MSKNRLPKYPDKHEVWIIRKNGDDVYIATTLGNDRSRYFLYKKDNSKWLKLGSGSNPTELENKYIE